ncbi:MAG TPA: hypothetical protein VNW15_00325 [Rhizomicrobium sp.]|nr:hypothetical protein [Rhizomicrobium sp.]
MTEIRIAAAASAENPHQILNNLFRSITFRPSIPLCLIAVCDAFAPGLSPRLAVSVPSSWDQAKPLKPVCEKPGAFIHRACFQAVRARVVSRFTLNRGNRD